MILLKRQGMYNLYPSLSLMEIFSINLLDRVSANPLVLILINFYFFLLSAISLAMLFGTTSYLPNSIVKFALPSVIERSEVA